MALEDLTGANKGLAALVNTNPDGLDPKSEGDNHLRGIKNVLLNTFGAMPAAAVSLPSVGSSLVWDGAKYVPGSGDAAGIVKDFAGALAQIPAGYLNCDGAAISRTGFPVLFAAIGTLWGVGDGTTTFNLPNLSRRATIGAGGTGSAVIANTVGSVGGEEAHALTAAENGPHDHTGGASGTASVDGGPSPIPSGGNTGMSGAGTAHNTMQPSAVMLKIIKA